MRLLAVSRWKHGWTTSSLCALRAAFWLLIKRSPIAGVELRRRHSPRSLPLPVIDGLLAATALKHNLTSGHPQHPGRGDYGGLSIQPMDIVNAAQRCNDVEVFLVRMREKGLLTSIAPACFKSAGRVPSNAGDDRQAPLGPSMEPTPRFSHEVSPWLERSIRLKPSLLESHIDPSKIFVASDSDKKGGGPSLFSAWSPNRRPG